MRKSDELKRVFDSVLKEVKDLQAQEEYDAADKKLKDLETAKRDYENAKKVEDYEALSYGKSGKPVAHGAALGVSDKVMRNRIFNKMVLGRGLTDAEQEFANAVGTPGQVETTLGKGGYLVPEEQMNTLLEFRRDLVQLKPYCGYHAAKSDAGKQPTIGSETGKLTKFDELSDIAQSDLDFAQLAYTMASYGDIIPVSNELLADNDIDLIGLIGRRFSIKAVNSENAEILAILNTLTPVAITSYKGIIKALIKSLDPSISMGAKIFTNQTGLDYLAELDDTNNRPLIVPDITQPEIMRFRGHEIVEVPDSLLSVDGKAPFFVGSMTDFVAFFERQGVEVAVSDQAGFKQYATLIRAVERFQPVKADAEAMVYLQQTLA